MRPLLPIVAGVASGLASLMVLSAVLWVAIPVDPPVEPDPPTLRLVIAIQLGIYVVSVLVGVVVARRARQSL
jgi:hypothetical protein